jgi:hypothetical protein
MGKELVTAYFKVLSQNFLGSSEGNFHSLDLNLGTTK